MENGYQMSPLLDECTVFEKSVKTSTPGHVLLTSDVINP
jgi:hypothetical protein